MRLSHHLLYSTSILCVTHRVHGSARAMLSWNCSRLRACMYAMILICVSGCTQCLSCIYKQGNCAPICTSEIEPGIQGLTGGSQGSSVGVLSLMSFRDLLPQQAKSFTISEFHARSLVWCRWPSSFDAFRSDSLYDLHRLQCWQIQCCVWWAVSPFSLHAYRTYGMCDILHWVSMPWFWFYFLRMFLLSSGVFLFLWTVERCVSPSLRAIQTQITQIYRKQNEEKMN